MSTVPNSNPLATGPNGSPEPTWVVAHLFPPQGEWSENDFYALHSNRMIELVNGSLEVLPMPTWLHQLIVDFLCDVIKGVIRNNADGRVLQAPLPIRLFESNIREPDVMYFAPGSEPKDPRGYPTRVDLAMEVVGEGAEAHRRDYEDKRRDYARAGIPEYWIVDPEQQCITVLVLKSETYQVHGEYRPGQVATGLLLPRLAIDVTQVMSLAQSK